MARSDSDVSADSEYEIDLGSVSDGYTEDSGLHLSIIIGQEKKCFSTLEKVYFAPKNLWKQWSISQWMASWDQVNAAHIFVCVCVSVCVCADTCREGFIKNFHQNIKNVISTTL